MLGKYFHYKLPFFIVLKAPSPPPPALQTAFKTIIGILRQDQSWPGGRLDSGEAHNACSASNYTQGTEIGHCLLNSYQIKFRRKGLLTVAIPLSSHTSHHHPSVLPPSIPLQLIHSPVPPNSLILSYLLPSLLFANPPPVPPPSSSLPLSVHWKSARNFSFTVFPFILFFSLGQTSGVLFQLLDRFSAADLLSQNLRSLLLCYVLKCIFLTFCF